MTYRDTKIAASVVIPTFNRRNLLRQTLYHLTLQHWPGELFEVLVVDDGSTDQTAEEIYNFRDRLLIRYFWQADEGFRAAAARNIGILNASSPVIIFMDSGVLPQLNCIAVHGEFHRDDSQRRAVIGYVYGLMQPVRSDDYIDLQKTFSALNINNFDVRELSDLRDKRERFFFKGSQADITRNAEWSMFWTCNASARTSDICAVGLFDENFRSWGAEDVELGYRLQASGVKIEFARDAVVFHCPHYADNKNRRISALINYRYFSQKHRIPIGSVMVGDRILNECLDN